MKKLVLAIALLLSAGSAEMAQAQVLTVPTVGAQDENALKWARNNILDKIHDADEMYRQGQFNNAKWEYENAQSDNDQWQGRLYNSTRLQQKIDDCQYAMDHNGQTRQQANREAGQKLAEAIINALSGK